MVFKPFISALSASLMLMATPPLAANFCFRDFLVGSNTIVTKSGYLLGVAANYILINELDTNDLTTCDFYNIKFIRFYFN